MDEKIKKKGRPLGSGDRNKAILGMRVTDEELEVIQEVLEKLKVKFKTNKRIILYLFEKYNESYIKNNVDLNELLLKLISKALDKEIYSKEEKIQLKRFYEKLKVEK
ncbi:hypothetical protein [Fusobacterium varium]|uniref:hypothetical protein n=1 Tax=Fusobacterium varium TaxID=856 RepID=UPI0030362AD7